MPVTRWWGSARMNNLGMQRVNEIRRNKNISQIHRLLPIIPLIGAKTKLPPIPTDRAPLPPVAVLLLSVPAFAQMAPAKTSDTSKGKALVDAEGMTLYVAGKSNCNGPCATNWLPLMANADAKASGDWSIVTRDDGGKQWAYKTKPLYTWSKDVPDVVEAVSGNVTRFGHIAAP
jgi:predicted lipoprotein with Yx(FWY)xxD motif